MDTKQLHREIDRLTGFRMVSKTEVSRRALSRLGLLPGWSTATPEMAGWLLYTVLFAPSSYPNILKWIEAKQRFFDNCKANQELTALSFIVAALADPEISQNVDSLMIESYTGSAVLSLNNGQTIPFTRVTDAKPDDAEIFSVIRITGKTLRQLGEQIRTGIEETVISQN